MHVWPVRYDYFGKTWSPEARLPGVKQKTAQVFWCTQHAKEQNHISDQLLLQQTYTSTVRIGMSAENNRRVTKELTQEPLVELA
eukprot:6474050-Amphidinium_carterae.1